ncbi:MAG TPA: DevR family CRISPR-associated autoregulator [Terracidiphilus sp.]|nr:DevR family CRISPR-associated autoregulator [Terracidiphilus sp.]
MKIHSLSLCARVTLDLHNLNSEGTEGNQQQTRMVHIIDEQGERQIVNAVSGDMFKHILVGHLTPLLAAAGEPLSEGARKLNPDRVNADEGFERKIKGLENSAVLDSVLQSCAVTDIAGTLITAGRAVARKSCVEFGWVVGLPDRTVTEQYFHVKYEPETRAKSAGQDKKGEGSVAGTQAIFHRPASSGVYALICNIELDRIGRNDITLGLPITEASRIKRARAAVQALMATLMHPSGAQRNTQSPHIVACDGVVAVSSTSLPAPTVSPLNTAYREQMNGIAETLNRISAASVQTHPFDNLADGVKSLQALADQV